MAENKLGVFNNDNKIESISDEAIAEIDAVLEKYSIAKVEAAGMSALKKALFIGRGIYELNKLLTPNIMRMFTELRGTNLGFKTDRDTAKAKEKYGDYPPATIKRCIMEGMMHGAQPYNNEINIIGDNTYLAKNFFERMVSVKEFPGLKNLEIKLGIPQPKTINNTSDFDKIPRLYSIVECEATWEFNGKPDSLKETLSIRFNSGMLDDAILGKATRKIKAKIYQKLINTIVPAGDIEDAIDTMVIDKASNNTENKNPLAEGKHEVKKKNTKTAEIPSEKPVEIETELEPVEQPKENLFPEVDNKQDEREQIIKGIKTFCPEVGELTVVLGHIERFKPYTIENRRSMANHLGTLPIDALNDILEYLDLESQAKEGK